jgi:hypothetical protein
MSGGMGPIASAMNQVNSAYGGNRSGPGGSTPNYVPPSQLSQAPAYRPTQAEPQVSPFVQQMMMQRQMSQFNPYQQQMIGLPALLMQMQGRVNQPMMRGPMPTYQNPALAYRPDMQQTQAGLRRVAPSVAEQNRLQAIEDAKRPVVAEPEYSQHGASHGHW